MAKGKTQRDPEQFRMTFTGHLEELRRRLLTAAISLVVGMGVSYVARDRLFSFILQPLFEARSSVRGPVDLSPATGQGAGGRAPAKASDLAREARELSKRALASDRPEESALLAARAASKVAEAVEAVEAGEARRAAEEELRLQRRIAYTSPIMPFWVSLELSLVGGICLSFGVILWQIWAFVAPGLYPGEKRYAGPFIVAATACFITGAGFGYRYVFPLGFGFLVRFSADIAQAQGIEMMDVTTVDAFVSVALKMLLAFGLVFELPVVVSFLATAGIVDHRMLWRFGRWFVVIAVTVAAILTPPDVISQVMMAVPLIVLYGISIGLAYVLHPDRRRRRGARRDEPEPPDDDESEPPDDDEEPAG